MARIPPRTTPYLSIACAEYSEHVGENLQLLPNIGEINFWYIRITNTTLRAGRLAIVKRMAYSELDDNSIDDAEYCLTLSFAE